MIVYDGLTDLKILIKSDLKMKLSIQNSFTFRIHQHSLFNMNPGVFLRAKAAAIDGFIIIGMMFLISYLSTFMSDLSNSMRIIPFVVFAVLYDPLMTSLKGQTIGHMLMGIKVVRFSDQSKRVAIVPAILRFIMKVILGWISLLTIGSNEDSRAIHDLISDSKVIYN